MTDVFDIVAASWGLVTYFIGLFIGYNLGRARARETKGRDNG